MRFTNRRDAGRLLAERLLKYKGEDVVIYALPRGGVILAVEIARQLSAPLDLIISRKIGHPQQPEYAIAAVSENGQLVANQQELSQVSKEWLKQEIETQKKEAKRRRKLYINSRPPLNAESKIAIIVDDGIATGLTMRAAMLDLKKVNPKKLIVAIPVTPRSTAETLRQEADEVIALDIPSDYSYLGAVGAYYDEFYQVTDKQVIGALKALK
ncbi:MAG: phosphoribosyltransferase family protein [Actinomycetota bacterium]|nr:phosphoribosyltransferase family protein [Actinomycetota bacterium]